MASTKRNTIRVGILTVSDTCSRKEAVDKSGPNLKKLAEDTDGLDGVIVATGIVPDEISNIKETLLEWSDVKELDLILTTGGTGFADRDVTPEATKSVLEKEAPGLAMVMLMGSLKITPLAVLSRSVCGIRKRTLIVNLPGSLKGSQECFGFVQPSLSHAIQLLKGERACVKATHKELAASGPQPGPLPGPQPINMVSNLPTVSHGHHNCQKIRHHDVEKVARRPRDSIYPVIPLKDALKIVMDHTPVLQPEVVDINDALARIVAEEIKAPISLPPFRNSIKDGYAVLASDGPGVRQVMSDAIAGDAPDLELIPGHVIRITTGAPIPKGADAVVQVEDTELVEEADDGRREVSIKILSTPTTGQDIRPIGSDLQEGTMLVGPGSKLSPPELGLLASVGITKIKCYRRPVVGVCSTGNELTEPSEELPPGHIYDSNRITMLATLLEMNVPTVDVGITPDTVQATKDVLLKAASQSDVIVTTGGVSMGEKDLLKYVLSEELKATLHFGRIFIKPGKPTTFCTFEYEGAKKLFFSLPGNPVSGIVTFNHFVLPCLRRMMGYTNPHLKRIKCRVMADLKLDPRPEFQRAHLDWQSAEDGVPLASTTGNQISSRLISMLQANALLALPSQSDQQKMIPKGSLVEAVVLRL
ncbi:gephyrin [Strongylocentrotus purpuratus]|uniref:MoaB/Mog domain-containing protein n=1 Tax=Strongylocentrotus purpuratus TaxID=7668 RepID=A0A7M7PS92_STRPU|nr:gephyrin [Strongylocentrotus purpuratus]